MVFYKDSQKPPRWKKYPQLSQMFLKHVPMFQTSALIVLIPKTYNLTLFMEDMFSKVWDNFWRFFFLEACKEVFGWGRRNIWKCLMSIKRVSIYLRNTNVYGSLKIWFCSTQSVSALLVLSLQVTKIFVRWGLHVCFWSCCWHF